VTLYVETLDGTPPRRATYAAAAGLDPFHDGWEPDGFDHLPAPMLAILTALLNAPEGDGTCLHPGCEHPVGWYLAASEDTYGRDIEREAWHYTTLVWDDDEHVVYGQHGPDVVAAPVLILCEDHTPIDPYAVIANAEEPTP
jgi:hypothetical protein